MKNENKIQLTSAQFDALNRAIAIAQTLTYAAADLNRTRFLNEINVARDLLIYETQIVKTKTLAIDL